MNASLRTATHLLVSLLCLVCVACPSAESPPSVSPDPTATAVASQSASSDPAAAASAPTVEPTASVTPSNSAAPASAAPKVDPPAWFSSPTLDAKNASSDKLAVFHDGQPLNLGARFVWSDPDKAWNLQLRGTAPQSTVQVGPLFWFKKGQRPRKGAKLDNKTSDGHALTLRSREHGRPVAINGGMRFAIEVLSWEQGSWKKDAGFEQRTGKASARIVAAYDDSGVEYGDVWMSGTFEAEVVMNGGPAR